MTVNKITKADDDLLKRVVDLTQLHEQDSKIIEGYRAQLDKYEAEAELNWDGRQILRLQEENRKLLMELGRG